MTSGFDYFIVLAAMRTGSNLLEFNLNALDGVACHGEAFNPHFIGRLKSESLLDVTLEERGRRPDETGSGDQVGTWRTQRISVLSGA